MSCIRRTRAVDRAMARSRCAMPLRAHRSSPIGRLACVIGLAVALMSTGCGGEPSTRFAHLELLPPEEELFEFPFGKFAIPIPAVKDEDGKLPRTNRLHLEFSLHAVISPADEAYLADTWQHHEGRIRDRLIHVCRNASYEDLGEPGLITLKARMLDSVQPLIGPDRVRRLLIEDVQIHRL